MTIRKMKLAWKYRRFLWKYRRLIAHRREVAAAAMVAAAVGAWLYATRRGVEAPRAEPG